MKRLGEAAAFLCLAGAVLFGALLAAPSRAQTAPDLPRWTYEDEVSFYKPLKGECQLFRDTVGYVATNMAMTTCYNDYQMLWPDIEKQTALSDRWILIQSIGDSGNSGGARMRLVYREAGANDWAFLDRGEPGKEPMTLKPRRAPASVLDRLLASIAKSDQIDDPHFVAPHPVATYITVYDSEGVTRKAFIRRAESKFPAAEFAKLGALEDALWKLGPYYPPQ